MPAFWVLAAMVLTANRAEGRHSYGEYPKAYGAVNRP
jgi:hypothetical protein